MADAIWLNVNNKAGFKVHTATINSTNTQTAALDLKSRTKKSTIFIDVGAGELALQIKGNNNPESANTQVLVGASAISADYDDVVSSGVAHLQVSGATTVNDTVITVTEFA